MKSITAALVVLLASFVAAAQSPAVEVSIAHGRCVAGVRAERTGPYDDAPMAAISAWCVRDGAQPTATDFRIRAWKEADSTRVVVLAFVHDRPESSEKGRETQIATFLISPGQSVIVDQMARYNAVPATVSAK